MRGAMAPGSAAPLPRFAPCLHRTCQLKGTGRHHILFRRLLLIATNDSPLAVNELAQMEVRLTEQTTKANLEAVFKALPDSEVLLEAQAVQLAEHLAAARAFKSNSRPRRAPHAAGGLLTRATPKRDVARIALVQALAACE